MLQALVVAGGRVGKSRSSSNTVLTLLAGTKAWTPLASLPTSLFGSRASLVGDNMRLVGGEDEQGGYRNEVKKHAFQIQN